MCVCVHAGKVIPRREMYMYKAASERLFVCELSLPFLQSPMIDVDL